MRLIELRLQAVVIDAQPEFNIRPVVLDDDVRAIKQASLCRTSMPSARCLRFERQAALVAMQVLEVRTVSLAPQARVAVRRFDLDDVCPPVGQLTHSGGAGTNARQVDDLEPGEGACRHGAVPSAGMAARNLCTEQQNGRGRRAHSEARPALLCAQATNTNGAL